MKTGSIMDLRGMLSTGSPAPVSSHQIATRLQILLDGSRVHWAPVAGQSQRAMILGAQDSELLQQAINRLLAMGDGPDAGAGADTEGMGL